MSASRYPKRKRAEASYKEIPESDVENLGQDDPHVSDEDREEDADWRVVKRVRSALRWTLSSPCLLLNAS